MPNQENKWSIKKWFEENFLDGDAIQNGQTLSSDCCLEAVSLAYEKGKSDIRQEIKNVIEGMKLKEHSHKICKNFGDCEKFSFYERSYNQAIQDILQKLKLLEEPK